MADSTDNGDIPNRTRHLRGEEETGEISKNAAKKAAKREKQAAEKASKSAEQPIGHSEAKKPTSTAQKSSKKKIEGAALIAIDVAKEDDFSSWYQQVLTKGDMLDYYDVSGCYILKVRKSIQAGYENADFCIASILPHLGGAHAMV